MKIKNLILVFVLMFLGCLISCKEKIYKVKYIVDGKEWLVEETKKGELELKSCDKPGYDFLGWLISDSSDKEIYKHYFIKSDITFSAVFEQKKYIVNFTTNDDDRCELDLVNRELKKVSSSINTLVRYYQKDLISLEDYKKKHNELLVDKSVFEMQKCKLNEKIYQRFEVIQTQIIIECLESVKEITALDEEIFNTLVDSIEVGTLDIQFTLKNDLKLKVERKQF